MAATYTCYHKHILIKLAHHIMHCVNGLLCIQMIFHNKCYDLPSVQSAIASSKLDYL